MKKNRNSGFTLIEVIIAVAILSVLAVSLAAAFAGFSRTNMRNEVTRKEREAVVSSLESDLDTKNAPDSTDDDYELYDANVKLEFSEPRVEHNSEIISEVAYDNSKIIMQKIHTRTKTEDADGDAYMLVGTIKEVNEATT